MPHGDEMKVTIPATRVVLALLTLILLLRVGAALSAQGMPGSGAQMPDPKQMSGMPLPVGDVAPGTVVVRVIRGALDKPIANQSVEIRGGAAPVTVKTNETGRAEFSGLAPGARLKATTVVDGETLESQEFTVPASGGIRLMLVATDPEMEKRAAEDQKLAKGPAQPGMVVLGDQSRFVFEMGDEGLTVFNILQLQNTARTPVQTPQPIVIDLPDLAEGAALLDGSSPQASIADNRVTITGPFAPGTTLVQFAYSAHYSGDTLTVRQKFPVALTQFSVLAQKVGDMHLASPQMSEHRDMAAEGQTYIMGQGPAVKAGDVITFEFTGLPHAATWPRNVAIALALAILAGGAWSSVRGGRIPAEREARRRKLEARRDKLFGELTALEEQHRSGVMDSARYAARRRELVSGLERIYTELDEEAVA